MAIISFWSNGKGETGKTSSIVAITTLLSINYNYKILVLDTKKNDYAYQDCFWKEDKTIKLIRGSEPKVNIESGIGGLAKAILSNKTSPEIITNYTRIVFKNRLELLTDSKVEDEEEFETHKKIFKDIAKIANKYYDLVFIDIDSGLDDETQTTLLENSDLIVVNLPQKLREINEYIRIREENMLFSKKLILPLLGKYDSHSKYNPKNVSRYIKERESICSIPYNTLFFEACNEGEVTDFFIKFRKINSKDKNAIFVAEAKNSAERIVRKLQELQMRM